MKNVLMGAKMLLKPLALQLLRKISCCGCSGVPWGTTPLQPLHFFANVVKPMVLAILWVSAKANEGGRPRRAFITRESPIWQAMFGEKKDLGIFVEKIGVQNRGPKIGSCVKK